MHFVYYCFVLQIKDVHIYRSAHTPEVIIIEAPFQLSLLWRTLSNCTHIVLHSSHLIIPWFNNDPQ